MNRIEEWTQFISKCLKSETELLGIQSRHDLYEDSARATFIRVVLDQFLPSSFAVGSGRVIDAMGNSSDELDIIIYRRDFPQLNLPGSSNVFLYESVLATIEVKTKLVRKTFFDAMDKCASMGQLTPAVNPVALSKLASRNNLILNDNDQFVHEDPLKTARFHLMGRPPTFVYAFSGYQTSLKQLKENIDLWIIDRRKKKLNFEMKSFPSVIATQGCFAWRNAAPLSIKQNFMLGLGNDQAPIRLIIFHLMNALNRRLRGTNEQSGLNLNLDAYINNIDPPKFTSSCGKVVNPDTAATTTTTAITKEKSSTPAAKKPAAAPLKNKVNPALKSQKKVSPEAVKPTDSTVINLETAPPPEAKKVFSTPPVKKAVAAPVAPKVDSRPLVDSTISASAAKKIEPARVEKKVDIKPAKETTVSTPVAKKAEPALVEKKKEPKPAAEITATAKKPDPVEMKVDTQPSGEITLSTPVAKDPKPAPVKMEVHTKPTGEITLSTPVVKEAEPAPIDKKPVSATTDSKTEDAPKLETYDVFKPSATDPGSAPLKNGESSGSSMNLSGNVPEVADFIEPELAKPEFIEPVFSESEPDPEPEPDPVFDLNTSPDPDEDQFEATMVIAPGEASSTTNSTGNSDSGLEDKPEPESEPLAETMRIPPHESADKPELEPEPFTETIQMPTHELEEISESNKPYGPVAAKDSNPLSKKNGQAHVTDSDPDPFSRTIPQ